MLESVQKLNSGDMASSPLSPSPSFDSAGGIGIDIIIGGWWNGCIGIGAVQIKCTRSLVQIGACAVCRVQITAKLAASGCVLAGRWVSAWHRSGRKVTRDSIDRHIECLQPSASDGEEESWTALRL